ncbi:MAG: phosphate acetyltransferase [Lentisphaeria bacterium]|nr:phosphate acetyltransferase [Lentisphaeria bacterium]
MNLLDKLLKKTAAGHKRIVLPEGQDPRVQEAAVKIAARNIAAVTVLATPEELAAAGHAWDAAKAAELGIEVINYLDTPLAGELAELFAEIRAHKGVTLEQAKKMVTSRLYFGNLMVRKGLVDGLVAGSIASTPDMLRAAFHCIGTAPGIKIGSSCFVMDLAAEAPNGEDVLIYADCGVNINPTAEELVDIAIASANTHKALVGGRQYIAFLSFSTMGSAKHELVEKMARATALTKARIAAEGLPFIADGEMQADAAIVPAVGAGKAPGSPVAGKANVLIFPDLQAGNICYKITERLGGALAYGPILQGLGAPLNDLSRGCSADDIVGVAAITVCQAIG